MAAGRPTPSPSPKLSRPRTTAAAAGTPGAPLPAAASVMGRLVTGCCASAPSGAAAGAANFRVRSRRGTRSCPGGCEDRTSRIASGARSSPPSCSPGTSSRASRITGICPSGSTTVGRRSWRWASGRPWLWRRCLRCACWAYARFSATAGASSTSRSRCSRQSPPLTVWSTSAGRARSARPTCLCCSPVSCSSQLEFWPPWGAPTGLGACSRKWTNCRWTSTRSP
mmetsp:Transcript_39501/g.108839  ORF Transcript_39501/g.108839 Transcript_39501/m.108839 type:complete len:225 (+) Transcript_39501:141-815(+)